MGVSPVTSRFTPESSHTLLHQATARSQDSPSLSTGAVPLQEEASKVIWYKYVIFQGDPFEIAFSADCLGRGRSTGEQPPEPIGGKSMESTELLDSLQRLFQTQSDVVEDILFEYE